MIMTRHSFDSEMLRWTADAAEQALRARQRAAREVHAFGASPEHDLEALRRQLDSHTFEEKRLSWTVAHLTRQHPVWPWLESLGHVNPAAAGKLLARLEIERTRGPECFWEQCDLSLVPGLEYSCRQCSRTVTIPKGRPLDPKHRSPATGVLCIGLLSPSRWDRREVLMARPWAENDSAVDPLAKKYLFLTVNPLVKEGGVYAALHRGQQARIERDRPEWHPDRKHFGALRKVKKRFLLDLWVAWRTALGQPFTHGVAGEPLTFTNGAAER